MFQTVGGRWKKVGGHWKINAEQNKRERETHMVSVDGDWGVTGCEKSMK